MNIEILFEDPHLLVCVKPPKVPSQKDPSGDLDMLTFLKEHLKKAYPKAADPYVGLIHRLDRPVGGIMVFGKTKEATAHISKQMTTKTFKKRYLAVTTGIPQAASGVMTHMLYRVASKNISKVVDKEKKGAKRAVLAYETLETSEANGWALLDVDLNTGRHHQIRVQLSHEGYAIWGDTKYNDAYKQVHKWYQIALWSYSIAFNHPKTGKPMHFSYYPKAQEPFNQFNYIKEVGYEARS